MKLAIITTLVLSVVSYSLLTGIRAGAAVADGNTWNITATSGYAGDLGAQFNRNAVRFDLVKFGLTVCTQAPKWDAVLYNEKTKKYMEVPHGQWQKRFRVLLGGNKKQLKDRKIKSKKTGGSKLVAGIRGEQLFVTDVSKDAKPGCYVDLWVAEQISPPTQFTYFLTEVLGIPADKGLPLMVTNVDKTKKSNQTIYETVKISQTPSAKNAFLVPKGMLKVEDEMQLLIDESDFDTTDGGGLDSKPGTPDPKTKTPEVKTKTPEVKIKALEVKIKAPDVKTTAPVKSPAKSPVTH